MGVGLEPCHPAPLPQASASPADSVSKTHPGSAFLSVATAAPYSTLNHSSAPQLSRLPGHWALTQPLARISRPCVTGPWPPSQPRLAPLSLLTSLWPHSPFTLPNKSGPRLGRNYLCLEYSPQRPPPPHSQSQLVSSSGAQLKCHLLPEASPDQPTESRPLLASLSAPCLHVFCPSPPPERQLHEGRNYTCTEPGTPRGYVPRVQLSFVERTKEPVPA